MSQQRYNHHSAWRTFEVVVEEDLTNAQHNLQLDEEIAAAVARGERAPTARVWRHAPEPGLVVAKRDLASNSAKSAADQMASEGCEIFVRQTGGTAVPHGIGVLNLSLIAPRSDAAATTDAYYRLLCDPIIAWFAQLGIEAVTGPVRGSYCDGNYNVIHQGQKLVGTAQTWRGGLAGFASRHPGYILAHACITVDVDLDWATAAINRFYALAGNPYRVDRDTAATVNDCLHAAGRDPLHHEQALKDLQQFLNQYFV